MTEIYHKFLKMAEELIIKAYRGDSTMRPYPPLADAVAVALQEQFKSGYQKGWNDRENDILERAAAVLPRERLEKE